MLRELRTHEQQILSQRDLLAREIRSNAAVVERYHMNQTSIQDVQGEISTRRWDQFGADWSALRRKHLELWNEVAGAYEQFERTRIRGEVPPMSGHFTDIAARLEEATP